MNRSRLPLAALPAVAACLLLGGPAAAFDGAGDPCQTIEIGVEFDGSNPAPAGGTVTATLQADPPTPVDRRECAITDLMFTWVGDATVKWKQTEGAQYGDYSGGGTVTVEPNSEDAGKPSATMTASGFEPGYYEATCTLTASWTLEQTDASCTGCECSGCESGGGSVAVEFVVWDLDSLTVTEAADPSNSATDISGSGAHLTVFRAEEDPAEVVLSATYKPSDFNPGAVDWEVEGEIASPNYGDFNGTPTVALDPQGEGQGTFRVLAGYRIPQNGGPAVMVVRRAVAVAVAGYRVTLSRCPESFIPEGGPFTGNNIHLTAQVEMSEDAPAGAQIKGRFRFRLQDVSSEPGYCLNASYRMDQDEEPDRTDQDEEPDLKFASLQNGFNVDDEGTTAETMHDQHSSADVEVRCFDYGAYGKIQASFARRGSEDYEAARVSETDDRETLIPRDDNGNHIADEYEFDTSPDGTSSSRDDNDSSPAGVYPGDGLSRYEEYRGFSLPGRHVRTSPLKKDVFYFNERRRNDDTGEFEDSALPLDYWNEANLGAPIHILGAGDFDTQGWITFNSQTAKLGDRRRYGRRLGSREIPQKNSTFGDSLMPAHQQTASSASYIMTTWTAASDLAPDWSPPFTPATA